MSSSATGQDITLTIGNVDGQGQNSIVVPVDLTAGGGTASTIIVDVVYEHRLFQLNSVQQGAAALAASKDVSYSIITPGTLRVVIGGVNTNTIGIGNLANIELDIFPFSKSFEKAGPPNFYGMAGANASAADPGATALTISVVSGGVLVNAAIKIPLGGLLIVLFAVTLLALFGVRRARHLFAVGVCLGLVFLPFTDAAGLIAGDLNTSGLVDAADVQLFEDMILSNATTILTDLDLSGVTNARDYQLLVNIALGADLDTDDDGLIDDAEDTIGTNPNVADTDGDGVDDGDEIVAGTDPIVPQGIPVIVTINEFVASNENGLLDLDGEAHDWVELYNGGTTTVDLQGWVLTDDEGDTMKWAFPSVLLTPDDYLVVFCSDKDLTTGPELHTNYKLRREGEYLGLYNAAQMVVSEFSPLFPEQVKDHSYGYYAPAGTEQFFSVPTPGAPNINFGEVFNGFVEDVVITPPRGFYNSAFDVTISTPTPGVTIVYTLNGSPPSTSNGTTYGGPISVNGTETVRAFAYRSGWLPTDINSHTYFSLAEIIGQSPTGAPPGPGWPAGTVNTQVFDYSMDPNVVNDPRYTNLMDDALLAIPSISIVTDLDNIVDPTTGIFVNAISDGKAWERPVSVELIDPTGAEPGFQINAGLRIRGGSSRVGSNPKHAFRLFFREEYGKDKLRYPIFGAEGVAEFDKLDLRTSSQYSWSLLQGSPPTFWQVGHLATLSRDVFNRDTQRDMGQPYTRSRYYHLYLNGVYWGLYQSQERGEARFAASYLGGDNDDYDTIKVNSGIGSPYTVEATDGTLDAWYRLWDVANTGIAGDEPYYRVQGQNPDGSANPAYERLLDVDNLIDYMLLIFYGGNLDSPITWFGGDNVPNNFYMVYNRENPDGFKALIHDAEHTMLLGNVIGLPNELNRDRTGPFPAGNARQYSNPQWMHQQLVSHPEYLLEFADHAHRHFFNDGAMTPTVAEARFTNRTNQISTAIIAESARWGDSTILPARTKDDDWLPAVTNIQANWFPNRTGIVLNQLRAQGWYPSIEAPVFYMNGVPQHGGPAASPYLFSMVNPNGSGTVYYTLDGTDPRQRGTSTPNGSLIVTNADSNKIQVPTNSNDLVTPGTFFVTYYKSMIPIPDLSTAYFNVITDPMNQVSTSTESVSTINYLNTGGNGHYGSDRAFPSTTIGVDIDDFAMSAFGYVYFPEAGEWTLGVNSDEGFFYQIDGTIDILQDGLRLPTDSLDIFNCPAAGLYSIYLFTFDRTGGAEVEFFAAKGNHSSWNATDFDLIGDTANGGLAVVPANGFWADTSFNDSAWTNAAGGIGYERETGYEALINTDVEASMYSQNSTICIRTPFTLTPGQVSSFEFMTLRVKYDDGFVAYLNGREVARANAPGDPVWNSAATTANPDPSAIAYQDFIITSSLGDLVAGTNVLAIQGLNVASTSSDFLVSAELEAGTYTSVPPSVAAGAMVYTVPFKLTQTSEVKARVQSGGVWSALNEATFTLP